MRASITGLVGKVIMIGLLGMLLLSLLGRYEGFIGIGAIPGLMGSSP